MTDTNAAASPAATRAFALRFLSCLRPQDILALQGAPLLGAALAMGRPAIHDLVPLAILLVANVLLVTHVFVLNDWAGLTGDVADPNKAARVFTARGIRRRDMGVLTAALLVVSLVLFACAGPFPFGIAAAIAALSALYSLPRFHWKGKPILNSLAHVTGGVLHFLLGYSIAHPVDGRSLAMAMFFGLIFTAGHLTQEVRDHDGDAINAIRTNAVVFGRRRAFAASVALFALAQTVLLLLSLRGILPYPLAALVTLFPLQLHWSLRALREGLTFAAVSRLQTRYRILYACIGLAMVAFSVGWGQTPIHT